MTREEALQTIKAKMDYYESDKRLRGALETLIPELIESEDERIIRAIIDALYSHTNSINLLSSRGYQMEDIEAWLEKQKKQKPILEVFGFKVGDAVRLKDGDGRKHIIKSFEEVEGVHGPNFYHVEFEDNSARDGIYPGEEYPNGYYTQMEKFEEEQKSAEWHPTHEQMVALSWAANGIDNNSPCAGDIKASLRSLYNDLQSKSIRPAEWREEDDKPFNNVLDGLKYAYEDLTNHKSYDSAKDVKEAYDWMASRFKYFCQNLQPKQEWSEEDEKMRERIISDLREFRDYETDEELVSDYEDEIAWLKSLPLNLKKKNEDVAKLCSNEWSEEDENKVAQYLHDRDGGMLWSKATEITSDILDILRPQPQPHTVSIKDATKFGNLEYERGVNDGIQSEKSRQWKPSEEVMKALKECGECKRCIKKLYEDLQKRYGTS